MGAEVFSAYVNQPDLNEAFSYAVVNAEWEYGHRGYTGTIAEKGSYVVIEGTDLSYDAAHAKADALIDAADPRIDDKWGPAGAIRVVDKDRKMDGWLFFGWASS